MIAYNEKMLLNILRNIIRSNVFGGKVCMDDLKRYANIISIVIKNDSKMWK